MAEASVSSKKETSNENVEKAASGNSFEYMKDAIQKALEHTTSQCFSRQVFAEAFPTVHKLDKKRLNELRKSTAQMIVQNTTEEFDLIYKEFGVEEKLTELDVAFKNRKRSHKQWRPSGNVENDLRPHLMEEKVAHINELKKILSAEVRKNRELELTNAKKQDQLSQLVSKVKKAESEFKSLGIISDD